MDDTETFILTTFAGTSGVPIHSRLLAAVLGEPDMAAKEATAAAVSTMLRGRTRRMPI